MGRTILDTVLDVLRWRAEAQEANLGHRSGIVRHSQADYDDRVKP